MKMHMKYKNKYKSEGRCYNCGKILPANYEKIRCEVCLITQRKANNKWIKNNRRFFNDLQIIWRHKRAFIENGVADIAMNNLKYETKTKR